MPDVPTLPPRPHTATLLQLLVVALFAGLRLRLLDVPLERDEGDYAYHAQLLLQGVAPYTEAYEMRPPGVFAAYAALLAVFGETAEGLHAGLLLMNAATLWLVARIADRGFGGAAGVAAGISFGAVTLSAATAGFTANTEHFVLFFALAGLAQLLLPDRPRPFVAGALLGLAVLMKQHAAVYFLPALVAVHWRSRAGCGDARGWRDAARLSAGAILPVTCALAAVAASGAFDRFWLWTVVIPAQYAAAATLASAWDGLRASAPPLAAPLAGYFALALLGVVQLLRTRHPARPFLAAFALATLAAIGAGLRFRPHGWLFLAPLVAFLAAAGVSWAASAWTARLRPHAARALVGALCVSPLLLWLGWERDYLFTLSGAEISRRTFPGNPFAESVEVGHELGQRARPEDRIAIFGSEPQILFYARRRSASPYILTYPLTEEHESAQPMQQEAIAAIERAAPRFVVHVNVRESSFWTPRSDLTFAKWMTRYTRDHYRPIGVVEVATETRRSGWDEEVFAPDAPRWLAIHERRAPP